MSVRVSQVEVTVVQGPPDDSLAVYNLGKNIVYGPDSASGLVEGMEVAVVVTQPVTVVLVQDMEVAVVLKPKRMSAPILSMVMV